MWIDGILFAFNILPIYPLDGGKILWSLLWFPLGRAKSLLVSVVVGMIGIVGLFGLALYTESVWNILMCVYLLFSCWVVCNRRGCCSSGRRCRGGRDSYAQLQGGSALGALWRCGKCSQAFDTFETRGKCPNCEAQYPITMCGECRRQYPMQEWEVRNVVNIGLVNGGFPVR